MLFGENDADHDVGVQEVPSSNLGGPTSLLNGFPTNSLTDKELTVVEIVDVFFSRSL
jgi:hypothetical protein